MDIDTVDPGEDFAEAIKKRVGSCDILIAVIGRHWLDACDPDGKRRIDNPDDFVRLEVSIALKRGIRVMPVLVDGAVMPRPTQLPEDLQPIAGRQAVEVSHNRFATDSELIISAIRAFEKAAAEQQEREKSRLEPERREREEKQQEEEKSEAQRRENERSMNTRLEGTGKMAAFAIGQRVAWTSTKGRDKEGVIDEIVPPYEKPVSDRKPRHYHVKNLRGVRDHESYIVRLDNGHLYRPYVAKLKRIP